MNRASAVACAACGENAEPVTLVRGRPVQPRDTRCSTLPLVARTTSSPSPTVGVRV